MYAKEQVYRVHDVHLNVVDVGEGSPALLFLHYWGGSSRTWAPTMEHLSQAHRCVAIDFRGWGKSSKDSNDHSLSTLASDVVGVIQALSLQRYVIIGHSMGGKVAQIVAARQPAGLLALVLFGPAPPTPMKVPEEVRQSYVGLYDTRQGAETVIANLTPHALPDAYHEQIIEDALRAAPDAKRAWPQQGMIEDISSTTSKISVPVHIIAGGDDSVEPEASLRESFGHMPGVELAVIPGVGHIGPLEKPAALADAIRSALRRLTT